MQKASCEILQKTESPGAAVGSWWRRFGSDHQFFQDTACRWRVSRHRSTDDRQGRANRQWRYATSVTVMGGRQAADRVIGAAMARHHAIAVGCRTDGSGKKPQDREDQEQQTPHGKVFCEYRDRVTSPRRVQTRPASARTAVMPGETREGPGSIGSRGTPRRFTHAVR